MWTDGIVWLHVGVSELMFGNNNCPIGINTMEKEIDAISESVFRFWDKDLMEMLFSCVQSNLFFMSSNFSL